MKFKLSMVSLITLGLFSMSLSGCAMRTKLEKKEKTLEKREKTIKQLREEKNKQAEKIKELQDRIDKLNDKISNLNGRVSSIEEKNRSLEDKLQSARESRNEVQEKFRSRQEKIRQLNEQISNLEQQKQQRVAELRQQNKQLQQDLSEVKEASTRREGNNVVISLDSKILFGLGAHNLKSESKQTLDAIADVIGDHPNRPVAVEGHTDTIPVHPNSQFPSNWHLSAARAVSVVQYLTENHDLSADRFVASGYGENRPVKPNTSAENRRQNRRVEIVLYPPELDKKTIETESKNSSNQ